MVDMGHMGRMATLARSGVDEIDKVDNSTTRQVDRSTGALGRLYTSHGVACVELSEWDTAHHLKSDARGRYWRHGSCESSDWHGDVDAVSLV